MCVSLLVGDARESEEEGRKEAEVQMELGIAFASVAYKYNAKYHFFLFSFIIFLNISLFFAYEVFKTSTRKTDGVALRFLSFFSLSG